MKERKRKGQPRLAALHERAAAEAQGKPDKEKARLQRPGTAVGALWIVGRRRGWCHRTVCVCCDGMSAGLGL
jgi:hypothetical protein